MIDSKDVRLLIIKDKNLRERLNSIPRFEYTPVIKPIVKPDFESTYVSNAMFSFKKQNDDRPQIPTHSDSYQKNNASYDHFFG